MKARRYPNLHYKTSSWKIIKISCTDDLLHCLTFAKHCICNSSKEEMANRIPFIGLEMNKWPECCEIASGGHCWCHWCMIELTRKNSPFQTYR
ncbi:hypothetical protein AVEN_52279-1 [Araneus ventricosus]|uniref:Uncharacterized protein n=1 Tax=Araneus ventricosus TaxID=182803 RepID=A0A4Y2LN34_ARAVE|nr:hypothetical protein AVEN_52279-1 [Araneus ventricosus]